MDGSHCLALVWNRGNWVLRDNSQLVHGVTVDGSLAYWVTSEWSCSCNLR